MTPFPLLMLAALAAAAPSYDEGMAARKRGELDKAREIFSQLLERDPKSGGALEGLSLVAISQGRYEEAAGYLERWDIQSPGSAYVLGLLARARRGLRDNPGSLAAAVRLAEADPCDLAVWRRLDDLQRYWAGGVFPAARIRKSLSQESLNTASPQRIIYEGRSGGLRARHRVSPRLAFIGGAEYVQDAQRNDSRGFTYYDIFDQIYSFGVEADPRRDIRLEAEYGQSLLHDIHGEGVGRSKFSRARLHGEWRTKAGDARLTLSRSPKYLRGAGGSRYFALLRESSIQGEFETYALGLGLLGRAGLSDFSEQTTYKTWSALATKELGIHLLQARYSHGPQEFYGATPADRIGYVTTDRVGLRARRYQQDKYLLSASYGRTFFTDSNRSDDFGAEATGWLPWCKELSGSYRLSMVEYRLPKGDYRSTSEQDHWLGAAWRHGWNRSCPCCWGRGQDEKRPRRFGGLWTMVGYEHGFLWDAARSRHEGNAYVGELEWYQRENLAFKAQGRVASTTVRDQSYSLGLQARVSF
jgi:tetratricopeptide (TPR) repeat protein